MLQNHIQISGKLLKNYIGDEWPMNLVLIGYRGVGKTFIGKLLAEKLSSPYISTDETIEQTTGTTISRFVHKKGWQAFREKESEVLQQILKKYNGSAQSCVLDTGGGIILTKTNRILLRKNSLVFWLKEDINVLQQRLQPSTHIHPRLLHLTSRTLQEEITTTYKERYPLYLHLADYTINCHNKSLTSLANEIITLAQNHIQTIIFDYGEVLLQYKDETFIQELATLFNVPSIIMNKAFYSTIPQLQKGIVTEKIFFKQLSKKVGVSVPKVDPTTFMKQEFIRNSSWNNEMLKQVQQLQKNSKQYKLAILSNIEKSHLEVSERHPQFHKNFKLIPHKVLSCRVGMRKPNKNIYRYALKVLQTSPRRTLFIDDRQINLKPAEQLGMHTILFKNYASFLHTLKQFFVSV